MNTPLVVDIRAEKIEGRTRVWCFIRHFFASDLSPSALLAQLRPGLLQMALTAYESASPAVATELAGAVVGAGIDFISRDPMIDLSIINPGQFLANVDDGFAELLRLFERAVFSRRLLDGSGVGGAAAVGPPTPNLR